MTEYRVLLFSVLRERAGTNVLTVTLPSEATAGDLLNRLAQEHPAIEPYRQVARVAVNLEYVDLGRLLHEGDEIALISPVSGG